MNNRLSALRKHFNMTQAEMGKKLGVTRAAISRLESGERNLTEQMFISICREFNVNEEWFRMGEGEMFTEDDSTIISNLSTQYNLDSIDIKIIENYLRLSSKKRSVVKEYIFSIATDVLNENKAISKKDETFSY